MKSLHPRNDDAGRQVDLKSPSAPTSLESWGDPLERATVIPDGPMPARLNGIDVVSWIGAPTDTAAWAALAMQQTEDFTEPPMKTAPGKPAASGVVILESDGRVWVVSPSNQHGVYVNTFPKGKLDPGTGLRANALKEGFEESGLQVVLTGFLCDSVRSTSVTRYYTARRVGGHPGDMGWESQAVHLVPRELLSDFVTHPNDQGVLGSAGLRAQDQGARSMWIFLPKSFISVVQKPGDTDTLTVRARIKGDIESVFPQAKVEVNQGTDYKYRAKVPRDEVAQVLHDQVMNLNWSNFKGAVKAKKRHDAYMNVWSAMYAVQDR